MCHLLVNPYKLYIPGVLTTQSKHTLLYIIIYYYILLYIIIYYYILLYLYTDLVSIGFSRADSYVHKDGTCRDVAYYIYQSTVLECHLSSWQHLFKNTGPVCHLSFGEILSHLSVNLYTISHSVSAWSNMGSGPANG